MPQVSVVIPVYNVGGYLLACLDSVSNQTLSDIEVICVDDGSTDESGRLLDLYAERDKRFVVIHKANAGVSAARNAGIEHATAPHIFFVDADDLIEPDACELIAKTFSEDSGLDIIKFSAEPFPKELSNPWIESTITLEDQVFDGYSDALLFETNARPFPWNGAYRTSFLRDNHITFPVGLTLGEDQVFSFKTLGRSARTRLMSVSLYRYRLSRKNSAMTLVSKRPVERLNKHLDVIDAILEDWRDQGRLGGESGRAMLVFVCSFVMLDILELKKRTARYDLASRFRDILLGYYSVQDMSLLLNEDRLKKPLLSLCSAPTGADVFSRMSIYTVVASIYGYKAALMRWVGTVRHTVALPYHLMREKLTLDVDYDDAPSMEDAIAELESREIPVNV